MKLGMRSGELWCATLGLDSSVSFGLTSGYRFKTKITEAYMVITFTNCNLNH